MSSWAYPIDDLVKTGSGVQYGSYNLPSAKAECERGHVAPELAIVVNPSLGVKFLGIRKGLGISRYSPR